jgi:hypothetical protein
MACCLAWKKVDGQEYAVFWRRSEKVALSQQAFLDSPGSPRDCLADSASKENGKGAGEHE